MITFEELGLKEEILKAVKELGFDHPTPIQEKSIPHLINTEGDLIATAQTGTGKTAAFGLPVLHGTDVSSTEVQTLILCPTRELCLQIERDMASYSKYIKGLSTVAVYGGTPITAQIRDLKKGAQIVVGTPGRTLDLLKRKKLKLESLKWVILDEADEMLSMGFKEDLDEILSHAPEERQSLLFSATMPKGIRYLAKKHMKDPGEISVSPLNVSTSNVTHTYYMVQARDRYLALKRIADINPKIYGIVFCRTRRDTKEIAEKLMQDGYNADAMHGDLSQAQRDHVMGRFRKGNIQLLVATDVAARGIDVDNLTHVINYNLPDETDTYVHRSGRTGRANNKGTSISIVHSREGNKIKHLEEKIGKTIERKMVPSGKDICEKQLFTLLDKVEKTEVDESKIAEYLPAILQKLSWLEKEDLIKRFISVEFNRFLEYYKDAKDLNAKAKSSRGGREDRPGRRSRGRGRDRKGRGGRDRDRGRGDRDRGGRGDKENRGDRGGSGKKGKKGDKKSYAKFFINLGEKNRMTPASLSRFLAGKLQDKSIKIGKIEVMKGHSVFEIDQKRKGSVPKAFQKAKYKGVKVYVQDHED